jgi:23S rRNA (uridine2552-2'-O)-methyltransferase
LDLGAAPGSWSLYLSKRVGKNGLVVAIDKNSLRAIAVKNLVFIQKDINGLALDELKRFGGFSLVVSDLAPATSGIKELDSGRSLDLVQMAWRVACNNLKEHGNFLAKIFAGESMEDFVKTIKSNFVFVKVFQPKASPKGSKEVYLVAKNFSKKRSVKNLTFNP